MTGEVTVGAGRLSDPAVCRLVEPSTLPALESGPCAVSAVRVKDVPVAVVAARLFAGRAEILSLAALADARETPVLGWAVQDLRSRAEYPVVYEPLSPVAPQVQAALRAGGLRPDGPQFAWFEFVPEVVTVLRPQVPLRWEMRPLSEVSVAGHLPNPDDLPGCSPVLLDGGRPVAYAVVRRSVGGRVVHWAWVAPDRRREGLIIQLCAGMFVLLDDEPDASLGFRVDTSNAEMEHAIRAAPAGVVRRVYTLPTWVS
jgi:hypothetical protein